MRKKISIIGAGFVGATCAHCIAAKGLGDVVLMDVVEGMPQGKALDLSDASPIGEFNCRIIGSNQYSDIMDSDLVIITAGLARKPGMSRDDLIVKNAKIIKSVVQKVAACSNFCLKDTYLIVVTNPLDIMTYLSWKVSGLAPQRVVGMAGVLDTSRFRALVARKLGVAPEDVQTLVLGGHGDTMVPLISCCAVSGIPLTYLLSLSEIQEIVEKTRNRGAEIVGLLKSGSAFYAPAAAITQMAECILEDKKRILPCCAYLNGQYGIKGYFVGVPVILGGKGVESILELPLSEEEYRQFQKSFEAVKRGVEKLKTMIQI